MGQKTFFNSELLVLTLSNSSLVFSRRLCTPEVTSHPVAVYRGAFFLFVCAHHHLYICSLFSHFLGFMFLYVLFSSVLTSCRRLAALVSLSDSSLSLAGPASLSGGSTPGLLLFETGPPGQPQTPLTLGRPLPLALPQVQRGLEEEVHFSTAGTSEDHLGGRGAGVRMSSTSTHPPPPQPKTSQYLRNPPNLETHKRQSLNGGLGSTQ